MPTPVPTVSVLFHTTDSLQTGGAGVGANRARGILSGTFAMTSSFGSGEKAFEVSQTITVTDTRISVTSISHVTQWDSGHSFVGSYADSKEVRLKVVFSDGTMFEDILDSDVPVSTLVEITSSQDDAIKAVASFVELKANYYKAVTLTASSICSATLNTNNEHPTITGTDEVYANLLADKNDVDIGANNGIPLPPKSAGELFEVAYGVVGI